MRFVVAMSWLGFLGSVALTICSYAAVFPPMAMIWSLFLGVFVAFGFAIAGHPSRVDTGSGSSVSLRDVMKTAPVWLTIGFFGVMGYCLIVAAMARVDEFEITEKTLRTHPEFTRVFAAVCMVFYTAAAHIAVSAINWWKLWAGGTLP